MPSPEIKEEQCKGRKDEKRKTQETEQGYARDQFQEWVGQ